MSIVFVLKEARQYLGTLVKHEDTPEIEFNVRLGILASLVAGSAFAVTSLILFFMLPQPIYSTDTRQLTANEAQLQPSECVSWKDVSTYPPGGLPAFTAGTLGPVTVRKPWSTQALVHLFKNETLSCGTVVPTGTIATYSQILNSKFESGFQGTYCYLPNEGSSNFSIQLHTPGIDLACNNLAELIRLRIDSWTRLTGTLLEEPPQLIGHECSVFLDLQPEILNQTTKTTMNITSGVSITMLFQWTDRPNTPAIKLNILFPDQSNAERILARDARLRNDLASSSIACQRQFLNGECASFWTSAYSQTLIFGFSVSMYAYVSVAQLACLQMPDLRTPDYTVLGIPCEIDYQPLDLTGIPSTLMAGNISFLIELSKEIGQSASPFAWPTNLHQVILAFYCSLPGSSIPWERPGLENLASIYAGISYYGRSKSFQFECTQMRSPDFFARITLIYPWTSTIASILLAYGLKILYTTFGQLCLCERVEVKSADNPSVVGVMNKDTFDPEVNNLTHSQTLQVRETLAIVLPELEAKAEP